MSILKLVAAGLASAALVLAGAPAHAAQDSSQPAAKKSAGVKKTTTKPKKAAKAKPAVVAPVAPDPEADEPEVLGSAITEYDCELGNKVSIYQNAGDDGHIALRWKKRLHRLTRVATTTGAQRFENKFHGLIWIGIPAKGMLLDSKKNRQLANECRNAEQLNPVETQAVAPAGAAPAPQI